MCGIVGIYDLRGEGAVDVLGVQRAMEVMRLRGPDDSGYFEDAGICLGHRRLAVIDPKGAKQPWCDEISGQVLVYNGEIYNFREVRKRLQGEGCKFVSNSDTETLIMAYRYWGKDCVQYLSGMFAFAIYDPIERTLFLARDRVGVKPLFYLLQDGIFIFASSISALFSFSNVKRVLDIEVASHYLTTIRTSMGRRTMIKGIMTLMPGEMIFLQHGVEDINIDRYWDYPIIAPEEKEFPTMDVATDRCKELFSDAVEEQLISDVPLGGFLSGGIDSCIISHLAQNFTGKRYNAYSVGYDLENFNEWKYVDMACDYYQMGCKKIRLEEDGYLDSWNFLIKEKGLPLSTPNEVPIYHLAKALKMDYTVALSGEGSDEIFGGYTIPYFSAYDYARARRVPIGQGEAVSAVDLAMRRLYGREYIMCEPDHFFLLNSWVSFASKQILINSDIWHGLQDDEALFSFYEDYFQNFSKCSTFDKYMQIHARVNLEGLLFRVDSSSMAASVETRVPFTDHRLIEYIFSLPDSYKIDWKDSKGKKLGESLNIIEIEKKQLLESKRVLRKAYSNNVPEEILLRPKVSFPVPFMRWFAGSWLEFARDLLLNSSFVEQFFVRKEIEGLLQLSSRQQAAMALWPIVNLTLWQEEWGITLS